MARIRDQELAALIDAAQKAEGERRLRLLQDLQERLDAHFRTEEAPDGWFARVVRELPDVAHRITALRADHLDLAAAAVSLLSEPSREAESALIDRLAAHEEEEAALFAELLRVARSS
ncbi:MAG: hypothetical protein ABMA64_35500 [Myxococcota bacterium]